MLSWTCLQDLLSARASSEIIGDGRLLFYPLGNTTSPQELSYKCLYKQAKELSNTILALQGFVENSPVLLHLDDHCDVLLWFWAVLLANGLPVLSTPFSHVDEHRWNHIQGLASLLSSPITITRSTSLHLFGKEPGLQLYTIESLLDGKIGTRPETSPQSSRGPGTGRVRIGKPGAGDPAMLMLTSGSTGNSKAVQLTHKQVLAAVAGKSSVRPLPQDKPFLNWIGLDHVGALVEIHLHALYLGVDQIHVHAADIVSSPPSFLDLLSRHQVSRSFAPNFFLAKLVASLQSHLEGDATFPSYDLSSLRFLVSGGEANDVETCAAATSLLAKFGAPTNVIAPGFGMTETCAGCIYNIDCPNYDLSNNRTVASLGKCIKGMDMRIVVLSSETKERLAEPGEVGNLQLRGDNIFSGYYRNPDATSKAFTPDGWFNTGDQAAIDSDGNLALGGRVNDVININGVKFIAADLQTSLEQALGTLVSRLVVFATRARHTEQITVAYVSKGQSSRSENILEINRLAAEVSFLSTASRPLVFSLGEKAALCLPISTLGKISRAKMRVLFEEGNFSEDVDHHRLLLQREEARRREYTTHTPITDTELCLINDFADILGLCASDIGVDTPLLEMGFTSMDLIRLKRRIDGRFGSVPIITILKHPTARLLAAALTLKPGSDGKLGISQEDSADACIYHPVVCLRSEGTKTPLWLVHPGVGEVLVFVGLVNSMADDDRPLFALRARGFENGQMRFSSINEAVDNYVAAIRERQPRGPYALAGYSYGAMLAFEVSKKLQALDGPSAVGFLGSFNLPPHIKTRMRQLDWNMCLLSLSYFIGLTTDEIANSIDQEAFRAVSQQQALDQILSISDQTRFGELGLHKQDLVRWADIAYGLQSMATDYEPGGCVECIDVFHAEPLKAVAPSREVWLREHLSRWSDFSRSKPVFHEVGGAHYTMLDLDHVETFSIKLRSALQARGL